MNDNSLVSFSYNYTHDAPIYDLSMAGIIVLTYEVGQKHIHFNEDLEFMFTFLTGKDVDDDPKLLKKFMLILRKDFNEKYADADVFLTLMKTAELKEYAEALITAAEMQKIYQDFYIKKDKRGPK